MNADYMRKEFSKRFKVGRIYLEAEPEHVTRTRKKMGGNRKTNYIEGWIEFERKKDAKLAALALNGQLIGGKKRHNNYHDDTWCLKYLSGFKWHHLTEKLAYDQKMRQIRLKSDMRRADKEIQFYQDKSELAGKIKKIEERRELKSKKKEQVDSESEEEEGAGKDEVEQRIENKKVKNMQKIIKYHQRKRREFKQREPILEDNFVIKRQKTDSD